MRIYTLPMAGNQIEISYILASLFKSNQEYFIEGTDIGSFFWCPESCIWNGGVVSVTRIFNTNREIRHVFNKFNGLGIPVRLTFTNKILEEKHMHDTYGNAIARIASESGINEVLVSNDIMENYIRENYPRLKVIQSITRCWYDLDIVNEKSKDQIVVLPVRYNKEFDLISQLDHKENIEILLNEPCIEKCPYNRDHYIAFNKYTLRDLDIYPRCAFDEEKLKNDNSESIRMNDTINVNHFIHEDGISTYEKMGFKLFKLSGRSANAEETSDIYCDYLIKDSFRYHVMSYLLHKNESSGSSFWDSSEYDIFNDSDDIL